MDAKPPHKFKVVKADFILSATQATHFPPSVLPEVALMGRSNVGKSSLLNALTDKLKLARVSRTPGRTRLINFFEVELYRGVQKHRLRLVDLPGYGYAKVPKAESEKLAEMLHAYLQRSSCLRLIIWLIDAKVGLTTADLQILELLEKSPARLLLVATKTDKLPKTQWKKQRERIASTLELPIEAVFAVSAKEKLGLERVWENMIESIYTP